MSSAEELRLTLIEALSHYRGALAIRENERRNYLPRKGKMPATKDDEIVEEKLQAQLEAVNRFFESADDMITAIVKPPGYQALGARKPISKNLEPHIDTYIYQEDEAFINPFTGQLVEPITPFTAGPSTGNDSWRNIPKNLAENHSSSQKPTHIPKRTSPLNPSPLVIRAGYTDLYRKKLQLFPSDIAIELKGDENRLDTSKNQSLGGTPIDGAAHHFNQPVNTTTESPSPATSIVSQTTSKSLEATEPISWKSWTTELHVGETHSRNLDPSKPPGFGPGERITKPQALARVSTDKTQTKLNQSIIRNDLPTYKAIDDENFDSFFPRKPQASKRYSRTRSRQAGNTPGIRKAGRSTENNILLSPPINKPEIVVTPKPNNSEYLTPKHNLPNSKTPTPVNASRFATNALNYGFPPPAQEDSSNWWETSEKSEQIAGDRTVTPKHKLPNSKTHWWEISEKSEQIAGDRALAQLLAAELSGETKNSPGSIHQKPEDQDDREIVEASNRQAQILQLVKDRKLAEHMAREYDQNIDHDTLALLAMLAEGTPQDYNPLHEQEKAATQRLTTELSNDPFHEPDMATQKLIAELSEPFYGSDATTQRLIEELFAGSSREQGSAAGTTSQIFQDFAKISEIERDRELARQIAGGSLQNLEKHSRQLAEQEAFARKTQQTFEEHNRQLAEQEDFARETQRILEEELAAQEAFARKAQRAFEEEHKRQMEEAAVSARLAQEAWDGEVREREEEARRVAELHRHETIKRQREEKERANEAARKKRQAEERARVAREAKAQRAREAEVKARAVREAEAQRAREAEERRRKELMSTCLICQDEDYKSKMEVLSCTHAYCRDCIKQAFTIAMKSKTPFACCSPVPIASVGKHFDSRFINQYNLLVLELQTPNPLFCGARHCSKFIPPSNIHGDVGTCNFCSKRTCRHCRAPEHSGICTEDKEAAVVRELARIKGWQTCPGCHNMVERTQGCLEMVCTCGVIFCYNCGQLYSVCKRVCNR